MPTWTPRQQRRGVLRGRQEKLDKLTVQHTHTHTEREKARVRNWTWVDKRDRCGPVHSTGRWRTDHQSLGGKGTWSLFSQTRRGKASKGGYCCSTIIKPTPLCGRLFNRYPYWGFYWAAAAAAGGSTSFALVVGLRIPPFPHFSLPSGACHQQRGGGGVGGGGGA
jgi:hypothetical protein